MMMLNVFDIIKAANQQDYSDDKVKSTSFIYYAMEKNDGKKLFGRSNIKINEYQTYEKFRDNKLISFPFFDRCIIYADEIKWKQDQIRK
jgi:hypothetical protein